ncbi:protein transport protein Sec24A [Cimex lectularius]|uniref:Protein transport protein Sec24A n=1 Tax=Cimex lectularius TaxID=79782 RepID=A0A8I6RVT0_CIMLE|nr:protein transport protein Sec24A [Cimex lectularius]
MNGQPYNYSASNSGNGTPTPSSTSYPASLSSQSSRDGSPSRLPPNVNHISNDKSINPNSNITNYKNQEVENSYSYDAMNTNQSRQHIASNVGEYMGDVNGQRPPPPTSVPLNQQKPQYAGQTQRIESRQENYIPVKSDAPLAHLGMGDGYSQYAQTNSYRPENVQNSHWNSSGYPPKTDTSYNSVAPYNTQDHGQRPPVQNTLQQNVYLPQIPPNFNNYQTPKMQTYPAQPTNLQLHRPTQEDPISSGPPRTNALGIIPYTEPVTSLTQGNVGSPKTIPSQTNHMPTVKQMPYTQPAMQQPILNQPQQQPMYSQPPQPVQQSRPQPLTAPPMRGPPMVSQVPPKTYQNQYNNRPPDNYLANNLNQQPQYQSYNYQQNNVGNYQQYNQLQANYYGVDDLANSMSGMSVQAGYNKLWGREAVDLLKARDILPPTKVEPPPIRLSQEYYESSNCSPDIFRCTLTRIPETKSLLDKSRLPLGVLIHPFKDLNQLSVIQCSAIVRCRSCRTYINPFVYFVDSKRWRCNLCFRVNDLPEEFQYDPLTKTYGDPSRRPEIKSATIEFIAPSEYMVRPPQPAAYVFVIDVSQLGVQSGYLQTFCECLLSQLEALPGDSRTSVAFITFDSTVHYYSLADTQAQPHQMVIVDIDDMFVPCPENLLVNLSECLGLVRDLLRELPTKYQESYDTGSALGPALQAAFKLLAATGGRISVFQTCLPNCGPGKLQSREDPSQRSGDNVNQNMLNPVTDFYKKLALDCSAQQIAVDLFVLNSQFVDLASLSGISKFSGGCIHHFPLFNTKNIKHVDALQRCLHRYLCRKIGFESVMRLRCTKGLSIHTFHGNFFVRSTDLLSLPNINPDAGFGMQVSIDENLTDVQNVCFQAALLYTSSKGERRIRVHTLCLPVASNLSDVLHSADQQCIIGLLAKMAVDRCHQSSLSDAREAFVNVVADMLSAFKLTQSSNPSMSLLAPPSLSLLPLYILALLKYNAFRVGQSTRLDDRVYAMCQMKSLPLSQLIQAIHPDLYPVHNLSEYPKVTIGDETVVQPPLLHLSAERIESQGIYLMDDGSRIMIYVGHNISQSLAISLFSAPSFSSINSNMLDLPELNNPESKELRNFINFLQNDKAVAPTIEIIRDDSPQRQQFLDKLIEDKTPAGHSYYEFLQRVKLLVK